MHHPREGPDERDVLFEHVVTFYGPTKKNGGTVKTQTPPPVLAVNLRQAAAMTGYSETTLRDAIYSGALTCIRAGGNPLGHIRLRPAELDRWLSSNEVTAPR